MAESAFQDQGSVRHCHGCGADNERGLRLKSYWDGDDAIAHWHAEPHHCGGTQSNLNGGIIASLIDCHSLNLAIAHAYRAAGRPIGSAPRIGYVTASLQVTYTKPTPIDQPIELRARITKQEQRKAWMSYPQRGGGSASDGRSVGGAGGRAINWIKDVPNGSIVPKVPGVGEVDNDWNHWNVCNHWNY